MTATVTSFPARRLSRWGLPVGVLTLGAVLLHEATDLPLTQAYAGIGPGFFVLAVGLVLTALGLALGYQVLRGAVFEPEETEGADIGRPMSWNGFLTAAAGVFLPIGLIGQAGFPLGGAMAYAFITRAYGSGKPLIDVLIGFAVASLTWLAFTRLGVQLGGFFPPGGF
ncbi:MULTISPECIES: tripartite tricarboxylate transporter TctB family protein [Bosea]|uniref:tripartite tricarboxylate transporter TctB family protein n=1 Tax=Bosea TaxID=85413 RepID=UPI00214FA700|nr:MULTISPECIES: tripartite tricarboxylate transporter TctB family protein [Bosea]MCR4524104.1 tripartite tricarboxylate transporter TctB family protein [Bosea sp. 47.2.35]MDR6827482.1 putative tricarboxylic transport membrane protein [Bosea robiniae]MDR6894192.1 putative tricarboxylic transport membrane protein [Bosea sp. BE109]MDR7137587.1 putative tricarboxylic transport membrane protein [Bosea sp. BE168]MDR7174287.1 putative tricarboxylic transport membrane protein [Bosea sp. BE271]